MESLYFLTLLRLTVPLLILRWPIFGIFASMYLDLYDYTRISITNPGDMTSYQSWDKVMDFYYLSLAFITSLRWKELTAKKISIFLYTIRAVGVTLLLLTQARTILILFPNVFESFFLFYMLYKNFTNDAKLFSSKYIVILVLTALTIPKILAEFYLHVLHSPHILGFINTSSIYAPPEESVLLYVIYLLPIMIVLISIIIYTQKSKPHGIVTPDLSKNY